MPIEYEYRYRLVDNDKARLIQLAASESQVYLLTNRVYASASGNYVRIRESKDVATGQTETILTVKSNAGTFDEENEVNTCATKSQDLDVVLRALGCTHQYTIQKLRTVVHVPGLGELDFDEAPGLPPFLEVEAQSMRKLNQLVKRLGLAGRNETFGISDLYFEQYGITKENRNTNDDLLFSNPSNLQKNITKNKTVFAKTLARQRKLIKSSRQ